MRYVVAMWSSNAVAASLRVHSFIVCVCCCRAPSAGVQPLFQGCACVCVCVRVRGSVRCGPRSLATARSLVLCQDTAQ